MKTAEFLIESVIVTVLSPIILALALYVLIRAIVRGLTAMFLAFYEGIKVLWRARPCD
jgi:hypothetical protein